MKAKGRASRGKFHSAAVAHGAARGSAVSTAKLTEDQVAAIKGEILTAPRNDHGEVREGVYARLAEHFGVTRTTIHDISTGRIWGHIEPAKIEKSVLPVRLARKFSNATLTLDDAKEIHRLRAQGMTLPDLARKYGGTTSMIWAVLHGRTWPDALGVVRHDPTAPLRVDHYSKGADHHNSKLNEEAVREMRRRAASGEPWVNIVTEFMEKLNMRPAALYAVLRRESWRHIEVN